MELETVKTTSDLFSIWRNARTEYNAFSNDGILLDGLWEKSNPKIAFLLKESNDDFCDIRGSAWGPTGTSPRFWRNLSMWTYLTTECLNGRECTLEKTLAEKQKPLGNVAYVNIKKNAESKSSSDDREIFNYIEKDWNFLKRQIEIIGPDVLFCCGTFKYLKTKIALEPISERIYNYQQLLVVDYCHPSFPFRSDNSHFEILHKMLSPLSARREIFKR